MASDPNMHVDKNGPVTTVVIDRPEARNACSVGMVRALHAAFMTFEADETAKTAMLTGTGNAFCAGADLKEIENGTAMGYCWAGADEGVTRRYLKNRLSPAYPARRSPRVLLLRSGAIYGSPT